MAPLTDTVPKPLLPVGNLPLIAYAIAYLRHHGIVDIMVNTYHLAEVLEGALGDGSAYGVHLHYSREPEILGTGGGLKRMHKWLDEPFVVINSDVLIEHDLTAAMAEHRAQDATATMVLRRPDVGQQKLGVIEADARGRVVRLYNQGELPAHAQAPVQHYMFTGVHILSPRLLEFIPSEVYSCVVRYGYAKALANQERILASLCSGYWQDAGQPADYLQANRRALGEAGLPLSYADAMAGYALAPKRDLGPAIRMGADVDLGAQVTLSRPVALGDKCRLGEGASVGPNVLAGAHVLIGKEANVRDCVLLARSEVGASQRLRSTIVGREATLVVSPPDA